MRFLRACLPLAVFLLLSVAGCRYDDEIRQDTVAHEDREPLKLRVAILRNKAKVWFIRVDGPEELMTKNLSDFNAFVTSVTFNEKDAGPIQWKEPAGWKKDPPSRGKIRYATYRIPAKPKDLEVKITVLNAAEFGIMDNMHRWQKQMNVPLSENDEDNQKYVKDETYGDLDVKWVNMSGFGVHTVSVPFDPKAGREQDVLAAMVNQGARAPFKYTAPEGWVKKPPRDQIILELFEIAGGEKLTELTLSITKGDLAENINRWRKQIELPKMTPEEMVNTVKQLEVAGMKSIYVDLANPAGPPAMNRTVVVIVPMNRGFSFFIKMYGPHDEVGRRIPEFKTFVESFKK